MIFHIPSTSKWAPNKLQMSSKWNRSQVLMNTELLNQAFMKLIHEIMICAQSSTSSVHINLNQTIRYIDWSVLRGRQNTRTGQVRPSRPAQLPHWPSLCTNFALLWHRRHTCHPWRQRQGAQFNSKRKALKNALKKALKITQKMTPNSAYKY